MYPSSTRSKPTTETCDVFSQVIRPQTPEPDERFSYSFKSLFTLADVAAKRRANGGFRKRTSKTDENVFAGDDATELAFLRRSKSSGDLAVLGDNLGCLNVESGSEGDRAPVKVQKGRSRAATTPRSPRSKIPKVKSVVWLKADSICSSQNSSSPTIPSGADLCDSDSLNVDDALFVLITPPQPLKKSLTLAAHTPSLPRVASPFSPRINNSDMPRSSHVRPGSSRSIPDTGHTSAALHLIKSHWEVRYDTWTCSLRMQHPSPTAEGSQVTPKRSRFPDPLTNPALFPRAGTLTPTALRPVFDESVVREDTRPALEVDWAMRAWPLDKIQRALFVHDMDVRVCFPISEGEMARDKGNTRELNQEPEPELSQWDFEQDEAQDRRWEWDWELRWKVIECMVEEETERTEHEYDVFLAEDSAAGDHAYGGCDMGGDKVATMVNANWEWSEDAMEVDALL